MLNMVNCFLGHITGAQFSSNSIEKTLFRAPILGMNEKLFLLYFYFHSFRFYRFVIIFIISMSLINVQFVAFKAVPILSYISFDHVDQSEVSSCCEFIDSIFLPLFNSRKS
ncbi:hypothetical protein ACKWTF_008675 [Chironomus riparius]